MRNTLVKIDKVWLNVSFWTKLIIEHGGVNSKRTQDLWNDMSREILWFSIEIWWLIEDHHVFGANSETKEVLGSVKPSLLFSHSHMSSKLHGPILAHKMYKIKEKRGEKSVRENKRRRRKGERGKRRKKERRYPGLCSP